MTQTVFTGRHALLEYSPKFHRCVHIQTIKEKIESWAFGDHNDSVLVNSIKFPFLQRTGWHDSLRTLLSGLMNNSWAPLGDAMPMLPLSSFGSVFSGVFLDHCPPSRRLFFPHSLFPGVDQPILASDSNCSYWKKSGCSQGHSPRAISGALPRALDHWFGLGQNLGHQLIAWQADADQESNLHMT